jgi:hypothetical protein
MYMAQNDETMNDDTGVPGSEETWKYDPQALLAAINAAYADGLDPEEEEFLRMAQRCVWDWMREDGDEWRSVAPRG